MLTSRSSQNQVMTAIAVARGVLGLAELIFCVCVPDRGAEKNARKEEPATKYYSSHRQRTEDNMKMIKCATHDSLPTSSTK